MKVSIVIPVYYNEDNLYPLYADIKEKFIDNYIINSNNAEEDYIDKLVNDLK